MFNRGFPPAVTSYPYWPPTSPQRTNNIVGRMSMMILADLSVNQIPRGRSDIIPLHPVPVPRQGEAEGTGGGEARNAGKYGRTLYEMFAITETLHGEDLLRYMASQKTVQNGR